MVENSPQYEHDVDIILQKVYFYRHSADKKMNQSGRTFSILVGSNICTTNAPLIFYL